jgi:hypothetical protein
MSGVEDGVGDTVREGEDVELGVGDGEVEGDIVWPEQSAASAHIK